jgi:hypothetical protein
MTLAAPGASGNGAIDHDIPFQPSRWLRSKALAKTKRPTLPGWGAPEGCPDLLIDMMNSCSPLPLRMLFSILAGARAPKLWLAACLPVRRRLSAAAD